MTGQHRQQQPTRLHRFDLWLNRHKRASAWVITIVFLAGLTTLTYWQAGGGH